ncbi:hypothetical protein PL11201_450054 [Planktothrix sp. PCC 11201]|nr:hypothetical protein PL11201_450054 [Planktothrix sp. PCC 11201]
MPRKPYLLVDGAVGRLWEGISEQDYLAIHSNSPKSTRIPYNIHIRDQPYFFIGISSIL